MKPEIRSQRSENTNSSFPRSAWECLPETLCVSEEKTGADCLMPFDAERRGMHSHAERGNEGEKSVSDFGFFWRGVSEGLGKDLAAISRCLAGE
jgi:hypothetical protein